MSYDAADSSDDYEENSSDFTGDGYEDGDTELYKEKSSYEEKEDGNTDLYGNEEKTDDIEFYPENEGKTTEKDEDLENKDEEPENKEGTDGVDSEVRAEIEEKSEYSSEVNDHISSVDELEVYQKAGLKEETVDGRTCLVREDLDYDYVNPKSGLTNKQLMEKGRAPYDAETGERIELHHIGQDPDAPLAELTENSEHGEYTSVLHKSEEESWRKDDPQRNTYYNNVERPNHWIERSKGG